MFKKPALFSVLAQVSAGVLLCLGAAQGIPSSAAQTVPQVTGCGSSPLPTLPEPRDLSGDDSEDENKKGTIGIVCTDELGRTFSAQDSGIEQEQFRRCLEEVVSSWNGRAPNRWGFYRRVTDDKGTIGKIRGFKELQNTIQRSRGSVFPPLTR